MSEKTYVGRVGFRYQPEIERPSKEQLDKLNGYSTPNCADGMCKMYTMDAGIRPVCPTHKICGPAVTVRIALGDNLMLHKALSLVQPGDVLVVSAQGCTDFSACGGIMMLRMKKLGVQGIIIDGSCRDIEEIKEIGLPVYARGLVPQGGSKSGPGETNFPIACGGVPVMPGDIIIADENGIVCVPRDCVDEVIAGVEKKLASEKQAYQEIANGNLIKCDVDDILRSKDIV